MDTHASLVVNCMLLALKTYPFKIYINDSSGVSAFNPIAELNLTSSPVRAELPAAYGSSQTSARSVSSARSTRVGVGVCGRNKSSDRRLSFLWFLINTTSKHILSRE